MATDPNVSAFFNCTWDVKFLELPDGGYQFFSFLLENNVEITVKMTRHDGARVYAFPNISPPSKGVLIGKLDEKGVDFSPDDTHSWENVMRKYESWPECLKQMIKAYEVASVLFS
jgi:hypothetical protein